jgi:hypothetical protein
MKGRIAKFISAVPFLVEYMPTETESNEIDLFQDRKVIDFKRMILENVKDGDRVGIPVPIGYDDIMVGNTNSDQSSLLFKYLDANKLNRR